MKKGITKISTAFHGALVPWFVYDYYHKAKGPGFKSLLGYCCFYKMMVRQCLPSKVLNAKNSFTCIEFMKLTTVANHLYDGNSSIDP